MLGALAICSLSWVIKFGVGRDDNRGLPGDGSRVLSDDRAPRETPVPPRELADRDAIQPETLQHYSYMQVHMAMPVRISVWTDSESRAQEGCRAAFQRVAALERVLSDYDRESELNRFCAMAAEGPQPLSRDLFAVLQSAQEISVQTEGAFDPTIGAVVRLWRTARRERKLPPPPSLEAAQQNVGFEHLILDPAQHTGQLNRSAMHLDLGGIAKGFIGDQVLQVLRGRDLHRVCFEAGGDIVLGDPPPHQPGWEIDLPQIGVQSLTRCGVSVSGDTEQFVEIDGRRYSHVIDPRTGQGLTTRQMAVVVAPSGTLSDALATAGSVLEAAEFQRLGRAFPEVRVWSFTVIDGQSSIGR